MNGKIIISCLLSCVSVSASEPLALSKDYWKDEAFLKSFNGSYRINARIEPSVSTDERGLLVSVQPLMADGKREEALALLTANELINSSAAIAFNAGNIQFEIGELEAAEQSYLRALELFPSFRRAHRNLGFVYVRQNNWDKALAAFEESIRLGDLDAATFGQLAFGRMQAGQYAAALQSFQMAQLTQPEAAEWKAGAAQCMHELKRHEEALSLLDQVIEVWPMEAAFYTLQASVYLSMDRIDDAVANLELVRRMGKLDASNHLLLANLHLRSGSTQLARPVMMAAMGMEQRASYESAVNLLEFVVSVRDWSLARDFSTVIKQVYPDASNNRLQQKQQYLLALVDYESGHDPQRAANVLENIIKKDPLAAEPLILLARHRAAKQRYQEAIMLLEQAARVEGHEYSACVELAKVRVAIKNYTEAVVDLDKALEIRPSEELRRYREAIHHLATANE